MTVKRGSGKIFMMYEIGLCPDWGRVDDYYVRYILERLMKYGWNAV